SVETLYQEYVALYNSMPVMDNVATSSEAGLMPTVDFHNLTEATYTTHANAGGYTFLSTSFADLDIDGQKLSFPWKADDNRLIFVMGSEDGSTSKTVTIEKYPQGHGFTANATPDEFHRGKLNSSDKSVYDVWLADQIMQSIRGGSNQGIGVDQTVTIDFIDPRTNRVTEFIYDVNTKQWTKDGQPVASRSGVPVTPEVLTPQAPVTEAQAMDAAIQSLVRGGMTEADARTHFESIYGTLPRSMPFMADATQGLFPNILNGRTLMTEPSHDPKNPSEILNAAEHGLETFSGGYMFGIVDGKWDLQLPSTDGTAYNVYFIGKTSDAGPADRNTNIGLYDYAPQYNFTVGASPNKGQEAQYPNREVLDPVWVAEGVAQAHIANPNTKLVVEVFVDTETGTVTKFTYDLTQGKWLAPTTETLPTVR
ncbi:MAG: hypothetical protein NTZ55_01545, partial [Candidatus Roizmanbacteria bacterium]|nr:hypothetical protein [Candidatus Roizmanbacteria bacterium]